MKNCVGEMSRSAQDKSGSRQVSSRSRMRAAAQPFSHAESIKAAPSSLTPESKPLPHRDEVTVPFSQKDENKNLTGGHHFAFCLRPAVVLQSSEHLLEEIIEEETRVAIKAVDCSTLAVLNIERIYCEGWNDGQLSLLDELTIYFELNPQATSSAEELRSIGLDLIQGRFPTQSVIITLPPPALAPSSSPPLVRTRWPRTRLTPSDVSQALQTPRPTPSGSDGPLHSRLRPVAFQPAADLQDTGDDGSYHGNDVDNHGYGAARGQMADNPFYDRKATGRAYPGDREENQNDGSTSSSSKAAAPQSAVFGPPPASSATTDSLASRTYSQYPVQVLHAA